MAAPGYYPDLAAFSLAKLKQRLRTARLLPSQQILHQNLYECFACFDLSLCYLVAFVVK